MRTTGQKWSSSCTQMQVIQVTASKHYREAQSYLIFLMSIPVVFFSVFNTHACIHFYRAMLCIRGTSHGPVSVCLCLSVTSRSFTKTAKRRITQTTPHDSPGTLVFWCQRSPRNSTGVTPYEGAECRWGGSKSATFDK